MPAGGKTCSALGVNALQTADSLTDGKLMKNSILITGASGGLIGASYFRELKLRDQLGQDVHPYSNMHRQLISTDNLNPIIFSLMANDLLLALQNLNTTVAIIIRTVLTHLKISSTRSRSE